MKVTYCENAVRATWITQNCSGLGLGGVAKRNALACNLNRPTLICILNKRLVNMKT